MIVLALAAIVTGAVAVIGYDRRRESKLPMYALIVLMAGAVAWVIGAYLFR